MKKLLLLLLLLPSISLANELYMQCQWDGDSDIFEYHYSKKGGLNVVKGDSRYGEVNYKKNQCKVKGENLVCKKHLSKVDVSDEYDNKSPQLEIDYTTTINRFTLVLNYNLTTIKTLDRKPEPSRRWTSSSKKLVKDCGFYGGLYGKDKDLYPVWLKGKCFEEDYIIEAKKGNFKSQRNKEARCVEVKAKL